MHVTLSCQRRSVINLIERSRRDCAALIFVFAIPWAQALEDEEGRVQKAKATKSWPRPPGPLTCSKNSQEIQSFKGHEILQCLLSAKINIHATCSGQYFSIHSCEILFHVSTAPRCCKHKQVLIASDYQPGSETTTDMNRTRLQDIPRHSKINQGIPITVHQRNKSAPG